MAKLKIIIIFFCITVCFELGAQSLYPGQYEDKLKVENAISVKAEAFELQDIRLLPGRFYENMQRDSAWMMSISTDRLLHSFRTTAGVWAGLEGGYSKVKKLGGWESLDCELRGHTTGHFLSAVSLMYASTGNECFKAKGDSLVRGLAEVQAALGTGYLSAYPEGLINRNLKGQRVWAPWYTLHKIFAGLIDQYLYADNEQALEVVKGMASWAYDKLSPLDEGTRALMLRNEFGGTPEAFWNLYSITGDERHKWLAEWFYHIAVIDPLHEGREEFGTKHTNTFIPKVLAEAREYELTGASESHLASDFFWHQMIAHHVFAPGCLSDKEHFFDPSNTSKHISGYTGETCCTYNMLKLSRHLFCWSVDPQIADYYELALYNQILGQQDPSTGMVTYFLPLKSGTHKVYSTPEKSFWCCVGSGFENHAKYSEAIYYHNSDSLFINLFIPSEVTWKDKGLRFTQTTSFPEQETTVLTVSAETSAKATLMLRYPSWSGRPEVKVNGRKVALNVQNGEYIPVCRTWKKGDRVEVKYPMSFRLEYLPDDPARATLFYGPVLLAGRLGTEGFVGCQPDSDPTKHNDYYTYDYNIPEGLDTTLEVDTNDIQSSFERLDGLNFKNADGDFLSPLYDIHRERYVVYWNLFNPVISSEQSESSNL